MRRALRGCPRPVAEAFCRKLDEGLAPTRPDVPLARRVFAAIAHPEAFGQPVLNEWLTASFEQVRRWRRRDLNALAQALEKDAGLAQSFRAWRDAHRRVLARKILGGAAPEPSAAPPRTDPPAPRQ